VAGVELPVPVERVEPLRFVFRAQVERVVTDCVRDGVGVAALAITLLVDAGRRDGGVRAVTRELRPARPSGRVAVVAEQGWALLEQWRLPAPVVGVAVAVVATAPLAADQGDLLVPSWRDAAMQVDAVCARVRAELDPGGAGDVVVRPVAGDAHRPEGAGRWVAADLFAMGEAPLPVALAPRLPTDPPGPAGGAPSTPVVLEAVVRLLDPPEPVEVERPHGCPEALWWRGTRWALAAVAGPERLDGDWWRGEATVRDYWRGTVPGEGELLFYHQPGAGWYLQGWYD
jgi:protein ImuB